MLPMKPYSIHTTAKDQICSAWMIYLPWNKRKLKIFCCFKATVNVCSFFCGASRLKFLFTWRLQKAMGSPSLGSFKPKEPCGLHVFVWYQNNIHVSVEAFRLHMHPWTKNTQVLFFKKTLGRQCFIQSGCFEVRHIYMNMAIPNMSYVIRICTCRKPWSLMAWLWNLTSTVLACISPWGYTCIQVPKPMGLIALQLQTSVKTHALTKKNCTL